MNMVQMVGIMVACYFITLTLLCIYRKMINIKVANTLFIIVDLVFFFGWTYASYQSGGLDDGYLTLDNISPMIMTLIPLTVFMSDRVKSYCNSAIAFLWVGMFVALLFSPQYAYIFRYKLEASLNYTAESACHLLASLYGAFLIISGQVKCNFDGWKKAIICMYSIIGFGVFLNFVFHKSHFGMDPYGDYSIYMLDIFGSFETTLMAYILGILVVITLGMQLGGLLNKLALSEPQKKAKEKTNEEIPEEEKA